MTATAIPVASDVTIGTGVSGHAWLHLFYYLAAARATLCAWNTLHWHQTRSVLLGFGFGLQAVQPYVLCNDCGWPQTHISCGSIGGLRPVGLERVGATARFLIGLAANFFCRSGDLGLWCFRPSEGLSSVDSTGNGMGQPRKEEVHSGRFRRNLFHALPCVIQTGDRFQPHLILPDVSLENVEFTLAHADTCTCADDQKGGPNYMRGCVYCQLRSKPEKLSRFRFGVRCLG